MKPPLFGIPVGEYARLAGRLHVASDGSRLGADTGWGWYASDGRYAAGRGPAGDDYFELTAVTEALSAVSRQAPLLIEVDQLWVAQVCDLSLPRPRRKASLVQRLAELQVESLLEGRNVMVVAVPRSRRSGLYAAAHWLAYRGRANLRLDAADATIPRILHADDPDRAAHAAVHDERFFPIDLDPKD